MNNWITHLLCNPLQVHEKKRERSAWAGLSKLKKPGREKQALKSSSVTSFKEYAYIPYFLNSVALPTLQWREDVWSDMQVNMHGHLHDSFISTSSVIWSTYNYRTCVWFLYGISWIRFRFSEVICSRTRITEELQILPLPCWRKANNSWPFLLKEVHGKSVTKSINFHLIYYFILFVINHIKEKTIHWKFIITWRR